MARNRRFMLAVEVSKRLSDKGRKRFYYDAAVGKIEGVRKNESGWGFQITRVAFEKWIASHPDCVAQPQQEVAAPSATKPLQSAVSPRSTTSPTGELSNDRHRKSNHAAA